LILIMTSEEVNLFCNVKIHDLFLYSHSGKKFKHKIKINFLTL